MVGYGGKTALDAVDDAREFTGIIPRRVADAVVLDLGEGGDIPQVVVDVHQGVVDELVSQYSPKAAIVDQTHGLISGLQIKFLARGAEQGTNFLYDTAFNGHRPRQESLWYKTGRYGTDVFIFLAATSSMRTKVKNTSRKLIGKEYPTKSGYLKESQPYAPATGRYLPFSTNSGLKMSPLVRFSAGFGQGWAQAKGASAGTTPVGKAGNLGNMIGNVLGNIF